MQQTLTGNAWEAHVNIVKANNRKIERLQKCIDGENPWQEWLQYEVAEEFRFFWESYGQCPALREWLRNRKNENECRVIVDFPVEAVRDHLLTMDVTLPEPRTPMTWQRYISTM